MDEQPAKVIMRNPDGAFVTVLERELAAHEAKGFVLVQGANPAPKAPPPAAIDGGAVTGSGAAAPLVRQARGTRKKKTA